MTRKLPLVISLFLLAIAATALTASASSPQASSSQSNSPDATCPADGQCFADVLPSNPFYTFINRIYQQDLVTGYPCGGPGEPCDPEGRPYYRPVNTITRQQMAKFIDNARHLPSIVISTTSSTAPISVTNSSAIAIYGNGGPAGVMGDSYSNGIGVYGHSLHGSGVVGQSVDEYTYGVIGESTFGGGVHGISDSGTGLAGNSNTGYGVNGVSSGTGYAGVLGTGPGNTYGVEGRAGSGWAGVYGHSTDASGGTGVIGVADGAGSVGVAGRSTGGAGVYGTSDNHSGVVGTSTSGYGLVGFGGTGTGVYADTNNPSGNWAGEFQGNVNVTGTCCLAQQGTYRIDDPLDPANKYLNRSAVESQDMLDVVSGNVFLDTNGDATVAVPAWFEQANRDFRYQFAPIGASAPNLYIAQELQNATFRLAGGKPGLKVSWQVTGVRQDPYAKDHPLIVEQDKPADEKGSYLYPKGYGQPDSKGANYEQQQKMKQQAPTPQAEAPHGK